MKEASGEANMTVITIVLIAIVLGIGTVVVRSMMTNTQNRSCCTSLGGEVQGRYCVFNSVSGEQKKQMNTSWRNSFCPQE